jgi:hypothetical protein
MRPYWDYFRSIEDDLVASSRYVEFCTANLGCYSTEFARFIMAACSECDMLFKIICQKIDPNGKAGNIDEYRVQLMSKFPEIVQAARLVRGYGILLHPFESWKANLNPDWWTNGYTKLKHERNKSFHVATLSNALGAVCGLSVVLFHFYALEYGQPIDISERDFPRLIWPHDANDPQGEGQGFFYSIDPTK